MFKIMRVYTVHITCVVYSVVYDGNAAQPQGFYMPPAMRTTLIVRIIK